MKSHSVTSDHSLLLCGSTFNDDVPYESLTGYASTPEFLVELSNYFVYHLKHIMLFSRSIFRALWNPLRNFQTIILANRGSLFLKSTNFELMSRFALAFFAKFHLFVFNNVNLFPLKWPHCKSGNNEKCLQRYCSVCSFFVYRIVPTAT